MILDVNKETLQQAVELLKSGQLIGLPTETVYGLAADATQDIAVARIFEAKNRPTFNPLIIHGSSIESFRDHVIWNENAEKLAKRFWPGALTFVLQRMPTSSISLLASGGLDTLAVRIPNHPVALDLLSSFKGLLAAPSANLSGFISPTQAVHVEESFPSLFILDGGNATVGVESTIIDLTGPCPVLLRPGGISQEDIEAVIGPTNQSSEAHIKAPGMMKSHYCTRRSLKLNVLQPLQNEAYLAFGPTPYTGGHVLNLSQRGDLTEAASNLFKMLRLLDQPCYSGISVAPIPLTGIGLAVNDRLTRAAVPLESSQKEQ